MRALFLNWRDVKHPKAGGAEYVTHELAKGLVHVGWQVDWFTASAEGLSSVETIDGVRIIRQGGPLSVQRAVRAWYPKQPAYDFVLDQSHGWPFFAPYWTHVPTMYFIHEVTGEVARYMLPWPVSSIYQAIEPWIIRKYAPYPALTVSESTKAEMQQLGYKGDIAVIHNSCDVAAVKKLPPLATKEKELTVLLAVRLVPLKRPEHTIRMIAELRKQVPNAKLWILGKAEPAYQKQLEALARSLGVEKGVKFWGFVSTEKKIELLTRAHVVTYTSIKEGWGLVVPEGNAVGTVGVTYNTAGLRDSNLDGKTGLLSPENTPQSLADTIAKLYADTELYTQLRVAAWERVQTLTWDEVNGVFQEAVIKAIKGFNEGRT